LSEVIEDNKLFDLLFLNKDFFFQIYQLSFSRIFFG